MKFDIKYQSRKKEVLTVDRVLEIVLNNRNIKDQDVFLHPKDPQEMNLADFGFIKEIKNTLALLEKIKKEDKMIVVYTDYDADGITGGAVLWETLHALGFNVMPYVPHRKNEGYGFSKKGIDAVKTLYNPALIISVDHGISARDQIKYATELGIDVIVTDHHLKPDLLPEKASAIFHIPELSGSGVSYFFSKMIFNHFKNTIEKKVLDNLTFNFKHDYLALAAIGIVADLVPLVGASRSVVKHGLTTFSSIKRIGLLAILKEAQIENKVISPYDIGFIIAPRINAVGRLEHAIDALRLLCTTNIDRADALAKGIGDQNRLRQNLVESTLTEAKKMIEEMLVTAPLPKVIVLVSDNWHEGIIGLIASRIMDQYTRPTIIITKSDGLYKGSARSLPIFHITNFLRSFLDEFLLGAGGHVQAAGFSLEADKLTKFIQKVHEKSEKLIAEVDLVKSYNADLALPLSLASMPLVKKLETLSPFGIGNPQPVFYSKGTLVSAQIFGTKKNHLKFKISDETATTPLEITAFSGANYYPELISGKEIELTYKLDINHWNNREYLRAILVHLQIT